MPAKAPTDTPTPTPALAPVLRPDEDDELDAVVVADGSEVDAVDVVDTVVDAVVDAADAADAVVVVSAAGSTIKPLDDIELLLALKFRSSGRNLSTYSAVLARLEALILIVQVNVPDSETFTPPKI